MNPAEKTSDDGLAVIHVALFRMATKSMAHAYRILGYKTHHGDEDILGNPWESIERAAEATWPSIPGARPQPRFTRKDWDELWGSKYDIVTDMACPFVDQLIEAYPNAKIVIVQRDFDSWWISYKVVVLDKLFTIGQTVMLFLVSHVLRSRSAHALTKVSYGLFDARNMSEIEANARRGYDQYYKKIRDMIPPERRLEYSIGDGWEPLCAFLGKDIPDVPFPRLNDRADRNKRHKEGEHMVYLRAAKKLAPWAVGLAAIVLPLSYIYTTVKE
ncbi:unnamed protein product [Clonostachys rhizophaga]|uniref:Efflux pump antibiotic resistance protein n=1 Tax=Clonostachys rhizophaga TaxID=160324 RepID=A0A9N9YQ20_9HYPO|nr:unnamed protein product [Clonostachys rhizophaga]